MANPWEEISLDDYENHMSLDSVRQLQALDAIMEAQFADYPVSTAMVLGVAGGNGLGHISREKYSRVYGIDINEGYLRAVSERYAGLSGVLECRCLDLVSDAEILPQAQLLIADLLIEYIGYPAFQRAVRQAAPEYVSCVIQINAGEGEWVSDSPYLHAFDRLDEVHHQMAEPELTAAMEETGYELLLHSSFPLPNGKSLERLDYGKKHKA